MPVSPEIDKTLRNISSTVLAERRLSMFYCYLGIDNVEGYVVANENFWTNAATAASSWRDLKPKSRIHVCRTLKDKYNLIDSVYSISLDISVVCNAIVRSASEKYQLMHSKPSHTQIVLALIGRYELIRNSYAEAIIESCADLEMSEV